MKFGLTDIELSNYNNRMKNEGKIIFALIPKRLQDGRLVWLEKVLAKAIYDEYYGGGIKGWKYYANE